MSRNAFLWPVVSSINADCEVTPTELRRFTRTFTSTAPNAGAHVTLEEGAHYCPEGCEWCAAHGIDDQHGTLDPQIVQFSISLLAIENPPADVTMGPGAGAYALAGRTTVSALDNLIEKLIYVREAARNAGAYPPGYAPPKRKAKQSDRQRTSRSITKR